MISTKKLITLARKWKKLAAASRRKISWPTSRVATKGHFVVYTTDGRRFMIPLVYLQSEILKELFKMAEEEFGLTNGGPITLACDSTLMEYAMSILQRQANQELEKAVIMSLFDNCRSSLSTSRFEQEHNNQHLLISSF